MYSVAVDYSILSNVFAGTAGDGLFVRGDAGASWSRRNTGLKATKVTSLIADPGSLGVLYSSVYGGGVYKSTDLGRSWDIINMGLDDKWVHVLVMQPDNPSVLYAGTDKSGIYKSNDGGMTWSSINIGLPMMFLSAKTLAPPYNRFPLEDNFEEGLWTDFQVDQSMAHSLSASTTNLSIRAISIDPEAPLTVYIGTHQNGVYKSTNGGMSWSASGLVGKPVYSLAIDPANSWHLLAGTSGEEGGLFATTNAGENWFIVNNGIEGKNVYSLVFDPNIANKLYAGTNDGLYVSMDGGFHWSYVDFVGLKVYALAMDEDSPDYVFVGASDGFYFSSDSGSTWHQENQGLVNTIIQSIYLDELSSKQYLGTDGSGAYRRNTVLP